MSIGNKFADPKKIYSILDRPPVLNCGGKLDENGVDSYWGPSLTLQSEADSANITLIMEKFSKTGIIDAKVRENLQYGDVSSIPDFHEAHNTIARASELFDSLDAKIRLRFQNDPAKMIDFIQNNENYDEAVKLGLVQKPKKAEPKVEPAQKEEPVSTPQA